VKPYQPEGLWQEVAMIQSNTREYKPGTGLISTAAACTRTGSEPRRRRRCSPSMLPPANPARYAAHPTSTPLQALVLWNDVQFVEASRMLASRTLEEAGMTRPT
jgi:hypothetical protein